MIERLAQQLAQRASGPVFGVPGGGPTLTLLDHLEKLHKPFILTHFEGAGAIMAGTFGRLTGRAGTCLCIKGPGLANMLPGLAVAHFDGLPLVAIAEAYGPGSPPSKAHKRIDQRALASALLKGWTQLSTAGPTFDMLALKAEGEAPGPVMLELAQPAPITGPTLGPDAIVVRPVDDKVLSLVENAQRPVVIAGTLAIRRGWAARLNALPVPVFSTANAKGVIDETLVHAAGVYTGVGRALSPEQSILKNADLIIGLGLRPQEMLETKPFGIPAVNLAAVADEGEEAFGFEAVTTVDLADSIFNLLNGKSWGDDLVASSIERIRAVTIKGAFLPAHAFAAAQRHFGRDVCAVFDTGSFCTIAEHIWRAPAPDACLLSGQGRYMGTSLPMGVAAALYHRDMPTVIFTGDGGIGPFIAEVKIAHEHRLPLLICLLSDGGFGSIRTRAIADRLTQKPLKIAEPSWLRVFEAFGFSVQRANTEFDFDTALSAWKPAEGPGYIECTFQPDAYEAMVQGIR